MGVRSCLVLEVAFVRRRGGRDRVYVTRADGTSTGWDFPSYGDWLPHDLCHLVVEEGLVPRPGMTTRLRELRATDDRIARLWTVMLRYYEGLGIDPGWLRE